MSASAVHTKASDSDPYLQVARKIVSESLRIKKGESVTIETWNNGLQFARSIALEVTRIGGIPVMLFQDESVFLDAAKNMPKDVLGLMGKHEYGLLSGTDAYVFITGPALSNYYPKLTREELVNSTRYNASWYEAAEKARLRGVRVAFGYVGRDLARLLGKSVESVVRHQLKASLLDLQALSRTGREILQYLNDDAHGSLESPGSKLEFVFKGDLTVEDGIVDDGDVSAGHNMTYMPPGLVWKQVDPASASGEVKISPWVTRLGMVNDAVLEFEGGRLVRWRSKTSKEKLDKVFQSFPEDKRILTALTVGINPVLRYGYGHDRFVSGAIGLIGSGFYGTTVRKGVLSSAGMTVVNQGKLLIAP